MKRTGRHGGRGDNPGQLQIEWSTGAGGGPVVTTSPLPVPSPATNNDDESHAAPPPLVQRLRWDFQSTFPQPTPEAIDAGVVSEDDAQPECVKSLHDELARQLLKVLTEQDEISDARRRGVDPKTGVKPRTRGGKERLARFLESEPARLERTWQVLIGTHSDAFGEEAANAFAKAIRARHAGIPVMAEQPRAVPPTPAAATEETPARPRIHGQAHRQESRRVVARLPIPRPLPSAIAAGRFGQEENGKPVRPGAHEVREITERHAEKLIDILDSIQQASGSCVPAEASRLQSLFGSAIAAYAEDFGQHAADRLEAYVRRQASLDECDRADQGRRR